MAVFQIENLTYRYPGQTRPVLNGLTLSVEPGEFLLVTGPSGCGKSTLVKALAGLVPDFYGGAFSGRVLLYGRDIRGWDRRELVREVGFLLQDMEKQLVFDLVERDIAFGPENLGLSPKTIRLRIAEVCDYLGITHLLRRPVSELSGGEKQKVALAGVLVMHPGTLVLDEPIAQLDPVAAGECLQILRQLNEEWGITIIAFEQKTEGLFQQAGRVALLDQGRIVIDGPPHRVAAACDEHLHYLLPAVPRMFKQAGWGKSGFKAMESLPLTVKEGRDLVKRHMPRPVNRTIKPGEMKKTSITENTAELCRAWVTYPPGIDAVKDLSLVVEPGVVLGIIGANGAGKSTLLRLFTGLLRPGQGEARVLGLSGKRLKPENLNGQVGYLQQNPAGQLWGPTVREEIYTASRGFGRMDKAWIDKLVSIMRLENLLDHNPRALSQGEKVRVAIAAAASRRPRLLLLDEPTLGLDGLHRTAVAELIKCIVADMGSVLLVAHDTEFIGDYAHRLVMMLEGQKVAEGATEQIFKQSHFYSPPAARLFAGIMDGIVSQRAAVEQLAILLQENRGSGL